MSARCFFDTNIFVYLLSRTEPSKAELARELIRDTVATDLGVISYQVIQEFFNVALKRFKPVMTSIEAERYLSDTFKPLHIVYFSSMLVVEALHLTERYQLSWYDSLIVAAAVEAKCSILYSEDLQHGQRFGSLKVQNPFIN